MSYLDATKPVNNSQLTEISDTIKGSPLYIDEDNNLVATKNGIEVTIIGKFKVNDKGKVTGGKVYSVIVDEQGKGELYRITNINKKAEDFFDAILDKDWSSYVSGTLFGKKDLVEGSFANDKLFGFGKKDKVHGYNGDDQINGGKGNDKLWGEAGNDAFIFNTGLDPRKNVDKIKDWDVLKSEGGGEDEIWLDSDIFKALKGDEGSHLTAEQFAYGKKPADDDVVILYHQKKAKLYYVKDGDTFLFAKVSNKPHLSEDDFLVI